MSISKNVLFKIVENNDYEKLEEIIHNNNTLVFDHFRGINTLLSATILYRAKKCFNLLMDLPEERLPRKLKYSPYNTAILYYLGAPNKANSYYLEKLMSNNFQVENWNVYRARDNIELFIKLFTIRSNQTDITDETDYYLLNCYDYLEIVDFIYQWLLTHTNENIAKNKLKLVIIGCLNTNNLNTLKYLKSRNININKGYYSDYGGFVSIEKYLTFNNLLPIWKYKFDAKVFTFLVDEYFNDVNRPPINVYKCMKILYYMWKDQNIKQFMTTMERFYNDNNIMHYEQSINYLGKTIKKIILPTLATNNNLDHRNYHHCEKLLIWIHIWIQNIKKYCNQDIEFFDKSLIEQLNKLHTVSEVYHQGHYLAFALNRANELYRQNMGQCYLLMKYHYSDNLKLYPAEFEPIFQRYLHYFLVEDIDNTAKKFVKTLTLDKKKK